MDEQELPIDIHYNKLLDWLIDRRHCDVKWLAQARIIREMIQANLTHLPSDNELLASFKERGSLNYFQCKQVLEGIKSVDGDSKSLFGKFISVRVQRWAEIVRDYEKKNIYLADCAQQLIRNVNYEIPALKQSLMRCQQIQQDCIKREQETLSTSASLRAKFISSCKEMGIEGIRVKIELQQVLSELPTIFEHTVHLLPSLTPALNYYQMFIAHNTGRREVGAHQTLPMLKYIMQNGNVTVYQWKHGTKPEILKENESDCVQMPIESGIDHEIDWGDNIISQDIILNDTELEDELSCNEIIIVEDESSNDKSADNVEQTTDLESVLSCSVTRSLFLDDVMELNEFLSWRVHELSRDVDIIQFSDETTNDLDADSVQIMLSTITAVLDSLTNTRTQHLLLMKGSSRYLERMATSLLSPQMLANKATAQVEALSARREEAIDTALALQPQIETLKTETKQLQKQIEQQISRLYNNREVNLIGEINVM